jgi:hypothetical protein
VSTDYLKLAADLAKVAPSQARLMRHMLVNPDQTAPEILGTLDLTDNNFRILLGKLRDRGIEVVVKRVEMDPADPQNVEYHYSIKSGEEVEHWAGGRQGSLQTAWRRVEKMMIRHLRSVEELDAEERGVIIGALKRVTEDIERVDVYAQKKIEEAKAEAAAAAAEQAHAERVKLPDTIDF